ncbi:GNAT family acetyltransferase [Fomitiporia mediterranea MF3/22]|uniref:GNAT family acetyltransferase n=1 Tax=Fomitiporia mediterranea (strain MF3/22) TaxID=694068 RepID=UPI0004408D9F|nr:GNAT family acetyltransferase [Fomitiporia mediterranea MF3/22]EJC99181.1 GNAT family acetyltransferase [Fomitiporia mediterranea MF3/22]
MAQVQQEGTPMLNLNFVFPIRNLESARLKLTPFDPLLHGEEYFQKSKEAPELYKYYPSGPFDSKEDFFDRYIKERIQKDPNSVLFAILDKTNGTPHLAGTIGLLNTKVVNQSTEIGFVVVFPEFQKTHVTSNAIGLLLHYCLELPFEHAKGELKYGPGLGLRRVQWQAHGENAQSVRSAERMGFRKEGLMRWDRPLREGKIGLHVSPERAAVRAGVGRHSWMLSLCWDDWELDGAREVVQQQMDRK